MAFDPAEEDPDDEKELDAPGPDVPDEALAWMYKSCSTFGILLVLRQSFKDHVVLIELRVHRIDLALSQSVVQSVVDGRRRNAKARSRDTVDDHRHCQPSGLLVGGDILELRQIFQFRHEAIGPIVELIRIRIFERVLILGAAHAVIHRDVLHRLHVQRDSLHVLKFGLQSADHICTR